MSAFIWGNIAQRHTDTRLGKLKSCNAQNSHNGRCIIHLMLQALQIIFLFTNSKIIILFIFIFSRWSCIILHKNQCFQSEIQ